jgi:hypothetical protein
MEVSALVSVKSHLWPLFIYGFRPTGSAWSHEQGLVP